MVKHMLNEYLIEEGKFALNSYTPSILFYQNLIENMISGIAYRLNFMGRIYKYNSSFNSTICRHIKSFDKKIYGGH